jgi:hypothetical protein
VEKQTKLPFNSGKAQTFHRSIFDLIVTDLQPWSIVSNPGFIRYHAILAPNYELASDKYSRSLLNPSYDRMKASLKTTVLEEHKPKCVSVCLDARSSYHHGYLGVTCHYIYDWKRFRFCMANVPFDVSHTGRNIYEKLSGVVNEWQLPESLNVCVRDNASNVTAAFNEEDCTWKSIGCLNHSLQLAIKDKLLSRPNVKNLVDKTRKVHNHASHSTLFYTEFYRQQELHLYGSPRLGLKHDVETRWNSTY